MSDRDPTLRRNAPKLALHVPEPPFRPAALGADRGGGLARSLRLLALLTRAGTRGIQQIEQSFVGGEEPGVAGRLGQLLAQAVGGGDDIGALPGLQGRRTQISHERS